MSKVKIERGASAVVLGLGRSGLAAVRFLRHHGVRVAVSEEKSRDQIPRDDLAFLTSRNIALETGGHSTTFCCKADFLVPSPGVPLDTPVFEAARSRDIPVLGELAIITPFVREPIIAVTGTNGKTTVTGLIGGLLRADGREVFVGGNIGTPVFDYLLSPLRADVLVLEVSSFQLEIAGGFRPHIALFLNFSPDHLDRHGSMERYLAAKKRIFAAQKAADIAILGGDDPVVSRLEVPAGHRLLFGTASHMQASIRDLEIRITGIPGMGENQKAETYPLYRTALTSSVNRLNGAAAVLAARCLGCSPAAVRAGLTAFTPPPNRMETVARINGVRFINDSKATNIGAMQAAITAVNGPVVLIAGGLDKECDFSSLPGVVNGRVKNVILIGEAAEKMYTQLSSTVYTEKADTLEAAVRMAHEVAVSGDTVLLAPGCASFDMFSGYAHRGESFRQAVALLKSQERTDHRR